jgi:trk system potassium uptake protein TrkH
LAFPPILVGSARGEWDAVTALAATAVAALTAGFLIERLHPGDGSPRTAMRATAIGWLVIGAVSAAPFYLWAAGQEATTDLGMAASWIDALFEGMSGITSTGLTVVRDPSLLPCCLQLWRSLLEWIGGVGVVVLALTFVDPASPADALYAAEGRRRRLGPSLRSTSRRIWGLYLALSIAAVSALWLSGVSPWVSLNHGLTGISTGGFTLSADSAQGATTATMLVMMVTMVVGATSFGLIRMAAVERRGAALMRGVQLPIFAVLLGAGIGLVWMIAPEQRWLDGAFQWVSALATCGFSATPVDEMTPSAQLALVGAMLVGGMAGSTAGGIKIERVAVVAQGLWWKVRSGSTATELEIRTDEGLIRNETARQRIRSAGRLAVLFVSTLILGTVALLLTDGQSHSLLSCLFEATSAIGCVGLSSGLTGAELGTSSKLVLITLMWVGRLEIMAVVVLFATPTRLEADLLVGRPATDGDSEHGGADDSS